MSTPEAPGDLGIFGPGILGSYELRAWSRKGGQVWPSGEHVPLEPRA